MDKRKRPHSLKHKLNISKALKGRNLSPKTQFKKGHVHSSETIAKMSKSNKGRIPWNKGTKGLTVAWNKGKTLSAEYRKKLSDAHKGLQANEKHPLWSGDFPSYAALHMWIKTHKIKPKKCNDCGKEGKLHWSNIDHKYRRKVDDFIARCPSCHKLYDLRNNLSKH